MFALPFQSFAIFSSRSQSFLTRFAGVDVSRFIARRRTPTGASTGAPNLETVMALYSKRPVVNCDTCGRDTTNKSRICRFCTGGHQHQREAASSQMTSHDEWSGECEYDYSEDALGPKQAEDRMGAIWVDDDDERRKVSPSA